MDKKLSLIFTLLLCIVLNSIAFAENPAFERYKNLINSGNFYIEYEVINEAANAMMTESYRKIMPKNLYSYAMKDGAILVKANKNDINYMNSLQRKVSTIPNVPIASYRDGKLYAFVNSKEAYRYDGELNNAWSEVASGVDSSNPDSMMLFQAINKAQREVGLPMYFGLFSPENVMVKQGRDTAPSYKESTTIMDNGLTYEVDVYESTNKMMMVSLGRQENISATDMYKLYYYNGELKKIVKEGQMLNSSMIIIVNQFSEATSDSVAMPKGCKVYKANIGDMDSLLRNKIIVESY